MIFVSLNNLSLLFFLNDNIFFQILNVSAIVLANLCVSYIMTSQNEEVHYFLSYAMHYIMNFCIFNKISFLFLMVLLLG